MLETVIHLLEKSLNIIDIDCRSMLVSCWMDSWAHCNSWNWSSHPSWYRVCVIGANLGLQSIGNFRKM